MVRAAVPVAAPYVDDGARGDEDDVVDAADAGQDASLHTEAEPSAVKLAAKCHFGGRVARALAAHLTADAG